MSSIKPLFNLQGSNCFRQRLTLATLSGKSIKIKNIRHKDDDPGIKDFEKSFLELLEKISNGTKIEINQTGTSVYYQPGILLGGSIVHECSLNRSIGYFIEPLLMIAAFTKEPLNVKFFGITNDNVDPSPDHLKATSIPILKQFLGIDEGLSIRIIKRGPGPEGGGEVILNCPCRPKLRPLQLTEFGKIKRVRGIAWSCRVAPTVCNRMIDSARGILNKFLPDVYIFSDYSKNRQTGKSPGFGINLVAETTEGGFLGSELVSKPKGSSEELSIPEDIGEKCAKLLLAEIFQGGCIDSSCQALVCLLMAMGEQNVSKVCSGTLSKYCIHMLRNLRDFVQVIFKFDNIKIDKDMQKGADKILLTCVGIGYKNLSKMII